jgi:hypothetical protein
MQQLLLCIALRLTAGSALLLHRSRRTPQAHGSD